MKESGVAVSILFLTTESFSPYGWIAALPSASNAKTAASGAGRAKIHRRATASCGGPGWPTARRAAEKNTAARVPNAPTRNRADTASIKVNTVRTTRQPIAAPIKSTP